jgi:hypothetical protein
VRVRRFRGCEVRIWAAYLETAFLCCGAKVPAAPQDTDAYRQTARACGYGDDTAALSRDHELAHTILAEARGLPWSPTLYSVAHGHPLPLGYVPEEEETVLSFQRWVNGDLSGLDTLEARGWEWRELARLKAQLREDI